MYDGVTILAIGRELQDSYCLQFNEYGHDKNHRYYDEKTAAQSVSRAISDDGKLIAFAQKYQDKLRRYWNFFGKFYTYYADRGELKLESLWPSFEQKLNKVYAKHRAAASAVLKAYIELRHDYDTSSACDYNQLEYRAKELAGKGWKKALVALEIEGIVEKRGSSRRPGERSIPLELIPLVEQVLSGWAVPSALLESGAEEKTTKPDEREKTWDLFICHASEDKDEVARPLAEALEKRGLKVWYDEFTLLLGDSLRRKIDEGLVKSRYGIVIMSPIFFKKDWTQKELDGLFARERNGAKVVLPVWHRVRAEDVARYSPMLSDRVAVSTKDGLEKVVSEVLKAIGYTAPREDKTTATQVLGNESELYKALQRAVTKEPVAIDIDDDMKRMFSEYAKTFTPSHFSVLEFLDNPRQYGDRHGVKFGSYMAGGVSRILEEAIPELKERREFYDQLVRDLYGKGLVNIDEKGIHILMTESGMFASRTTENGRKFLEFLTKRNMNASA